MMTSGVSFLFVADPENNSKNVPLESIVSEPSTHTTVNDAADCNRL